jgi:hypothetical protein
VIPSAVEFVVVFVMFGPLAGPEVKTKLSMYDRNVGYTHKSKAHMTRFLSIDEMLACTASFSSYFSRAISNCFDIARFLDLLVSETIENLKRCMYTVYLI